MYVILHDTNKLIFPNTFPTTRHVSMEDLFQPRPQGLSSSRSLSRSGGQEEERPWERFWVLLNLLSSILANH